MNGNIRNAPCPCGSGRKTKHCCAGVQPSPRVIDDDCPICRLLAEVPPDEAGEGFAVHSLEDPDLAARVIEEMLRAPGGATFVGPDLEDLLRGE